MRTPESLPSKTGETFFTRFAPGQTCDITAPNRPVMLDFCGKHKIVSDNELVGVSQIESAYDRIVKSDMRYRFVIDMAALGA